MQTRKIEGRLGANLILRISLTEWTMVAHLSFYAVLRLAFYVVHRKAYCSENSCWKQLKSRLNGYAKAPQIPLICRVTHQTPCTMPNHRVAGSELGIARAPSKPRGGTGPNCRIAHLGTI